MYKRILVPLDGSELAQQILPYARLLAKGLQSRVELLQVIEPARPELADPAHGRYLDKVAASMRDEADSYLQGMAAPLRAVGLEVSRAVHEGDPASHIISEAGKEPATLVAMSTHGRAGMSRWLLGSVTDKVLHATTNPLLVVRSQPPETLTPDVKLNAVIVPLDGSALAEQVLPHVVALAKPLHLPVILTRIVSPLSTYYDSAAYIGFDYGRFFEEETARAVAYLHEIRRKLERQGVSPVEERPQSGSAAGAIVDVTQEVPGSLVAMSTHGRSGVGRWVLGSVADRVVHHSRAPVLVIRAMNE